MANNAGGNKEMTEKLFGTTKESWSKEIKDNPRKAVDHIMIILQWIKDDLKKEQDRTRSYEEKYKDILSKLGAIAKEHEREIGKSSAIMLETV